MGSSSIDRAAVDSIAHRGDVQATLYEVARRILEDSDRNIITMGAIDTSRMLQSGAVEQEGTLTRVSYDAVNPQDDFAYPRVVHDGTGQGRNSVPRPFLLEAATRQRDLP